LYPRSAYLGWPHQALTAMSCSFVRARNPSRPKPRLGCRVTRATLFHRLRVSPPRC
jgi:hypothetical protein